MNNLLAKLNMEEISPYFDECYDKIKDDTSFPYWLTEEYIKEIIIGKYDLLPESADGVLASLRELVKNSDLVQFAKVLYEMARGNGDGREILETMKFPDLPEANLIGVFPILACYPQTYEELKEVGADEKILQDTFRMLDVFLTDTLNSHGAYLFSPTGFWWTGLAKNKLIFRVDRLNFERMKNARLGVYAFVNKAGETAVLMDKGVPIAADGQYAHAGAAFMTDFTETAEYWEGFMPDSLTATVKNEKTKLLKNEWSIFYASGDDAVSVHIPRLGSFEPEIIEGALTKGKKIFKKLFPDFKPTAFFCESWLLAPELSIFLKPESNILSFSQRFYKYPSEACCGKDVFTYIFRMPVPEKITECDLAALPEESSLQKKIKDHYLSGRIVHEANGIFPY